jgi:hypothetical protein
MVMFMLDHPGGELGFRRELLEVEGDIPHHPFGDFNGAFLGNQDAFDRPPGSVPAGFPAPFQVLLGEFGSHQVNWKVVNPKKECFASF